MCQQYLAEIFRYSHHFQGKAAIEEPFLNTKSKILTKATATLEIKQLCSTLNYIPFELQYFRSKYFSSI